MTLFETSGWFLRLVALTHYQGENDYVRVISLSPISDNLCHSQLITIMWFVNKNAVFKLLITWYYPFYFCRQIFLTLHFACMYIIFAQMMITIFAWTWLVFIREVMYKQEKGSKWDKNNHTFLSNPIQKPNACNWFLLSSLYLLKRQEIPCVPLWKKGFFFSLFADRVRC